MHLIHMVADIISHLMSGLLGSVQTGNKALNVAREAALLAVKFDIPRLRIIGGKACLRRGICGHNIQTVVIVISAATVFNILLAICEGGRRIILRGAGA